MRLKTNGAIYLFSRHRASIRFFSAQLNEKPMSDKELIESLKKQLKSRDDQVLAMTADLQKLRTIGAALSSVVPEFRTLMAGAEDSAVVALIEFARKKSLRVRELEAELRKVKANA